MHPILLVEQDQSLCKLISPHMAAQGMATTVVSDGASALERAATEEFSAVVASLMLPDMGGLDLLMAIRQQHGTPVIMLADEDADVDRILALEMGADDCLGKPFNPRELVARIKAVLRRAVLHNAAPTPFVSPLRDKQLITIGDVELEPCSRAVTCNGKAVELTSVEFSMLEILLQAAGEVTSREQLSREVLGRELAPYDRSVDVHISNIRRKLGTHADGSRRIRTVRGMGYLYAYMASPRAPRPDLLQRIVRDDDAPSRQSSCA